MRSHGQLALLGAFLLAPTAEGAARSSTGSTSSLLAGQRPASVPKNDSPDETFEDVARRATEAHQARRFEEAERLYRQGLDLRPGWTEGCFGLGVALYELDRFPEARVAFRRVLADAPESAAAWTMAGLCSYRLEEYETALAEVHKGRELPVGEPQDLKAVANYHFGILLIRFGRYEMAFEALREFAVRERDSPEVVEAFGLSVLRLPVLPSDAPVEKREMILMAGRAGYQLARGLRSGATRRTFELLVERYPEEPNVRYAWGVFLLQDEPEAALGEFRRTLRLDPAHVPAMCRIAVQMVKQGLYEEALPTADLAARTNPQNFVARNVLGRVLLELGETDRAVEELEEAARLAPDSAQAFLHLARAYQHAGRKEDAEEARVTFLRLDMAARGRTASGAGESPVE